jgi:amino acid transporter
MEPTRVLPANNAPLSGSAAGSTESGSTEAASKPTLVRGLGLLDSVLLLVSGIIGSSIFLTAKDIAGPLPQPMLFLLVWVLGALISLSACFAFAELGSMFPDSGGQYIYLREAYGDLVAFLYGWMLFSVANGGSIAALSVASAAYLGQVFPQSFRRITWSWPSPELRSRAHICWVCC